jgi:hypothetical protein
LIVTGDNAIAYGVSPALSFSPSLPSGALRRKWSDPLRALLGEMKVVVWIDTHLSAGIARSQRDGKALADEQRRDQCSRGKHSDCLLHDSNSCVEWSDQTDRAPYGFVHRLDVRIATNIAGLLLSHPITRPHHRCSSTEIRIDVAE